MHIKTKYLGEVEIETNEVISFPKGLLGFEENNQFILLELKENTHYKFLQDINNPHICFMVVNPWFFFQNYEVDLPDDELKEMGISSSDLSRLELYVIVTLENDFYKSTGNLLAPIAINTVDKIGQQFIAQDTLYTTKHKLFTKETGE